LGLIALVIAALSLGCGGAASDGSTTIVATGEHGFTAVQAKAAIWTKSTTGSDGVTYYLNRVTVVAGNVDNICDVVRSGIGPPGLTRIMSSVQVYGTSPAVVTPGTYDAGATLDAFDVGCTSSTSMGGTGTLTLSSITADEVSGSLDFTVFDTHVGGTFKAAVQCPPETSIIDLRCRPY
jgi:hypothetical protein